MIEVKNLYKTYDRRKRTSNTVLHDVTFSLPDRGFVCILGPSGCGKTSLLNAVGGLDTFDSGKLTVDGLTVSRYGTRSFELARNRNFGYIFQNYYLLPEHSAAYNVYLGLHSLGLSHKEKIKRVKLALKAVDMERYIRRNVEELSGGQQQRVAIARALARQPRVIFADEPTGNLDEENTRAVCTLLRRASKNSLVIMVTHEESIARFFADRIIRLSDGRIVSDSESWERGGLTSSSDNVIYTGELDEKTLGAEDSVTFRLLTEPNAAPAELTVAVLRDRVIIKMSDTRTVTLGKPDDAPVIVDGDRPTLAIDEIDKSEDDASAELLRGESAPPAHPGKGLTLPMMANEAMHLRHGGKMRRAGTWIFLALLTALVLVVVGDLINLSFIDPNDFLTSDPHMLTVNTAQGQEVTSDLELNRYDFASALDEKLRGEGLVYDLIPPITARSVYKVTTFYQIGELSVEFPTAMAYAPIDRLDESTLIFGRMPEKNYEIVVDRLVLEAMMEGDSLVLNSISDISFFVDTKLEVTKRGYSLTICGICDGGSRTAYISKSAMLAMTNMSADVISLDELKALFPGKYDDVTLGVDECILNTAAVGSIWSERTGEIYRPGGMGNYTVKGTVELDERYAVVLSDEAINERILSLLSSSYQIYCADKNAVLPVVEDFIKSYDDKAIIPSVSDNYEQQRLEFESAASVRLDARSIVTASVLLICVVMLYLLCRTQARERLGLVSVYRLLGIPGRKLCTIFFIEGAVSAFTAVIPTAALTWAVIAALQRWSGIAIPLVLPWYAAVLAGLGIVVCYLVVSVLPLLSILRLPPARLAARYE